MPGTLNAKDPADVRPVRLVHADGPRHEPSAFGAHIVAAEPRSQRTPTRGGKQQAQTFELDPEALPPAEKWQALQASDPRVLLSWSREREDFQDQSPSTYDLSLAAFAVRAEWADQEIVDLLIAGRREHGDKLKLRVDYYERTIRHARGEDSSEGAQGLPQIVVNGRQLRSKIDDSHRALVAANEPPGEFIYAGLYSRLRRDGDRPRIEAHTPDSLRGRLTRVADFVKCDGQDDDGDPKFVPVSPPVDAVRALLAEMSWANIPPLTGIIECPTLRSDGTILDSPRLRQRDGPLL